MMELLLGLLGGFILTELHVCLPALAKWIVRRHVAQLPAELRERMEEEWLAEVDASPSHVQKVIFALGLLTGTTDLVRANREQKLPEIHGDVTVTLEGVSADGSVGDVMPSEPGGTQLSGQAHIRIRVPTAVFSVGVNTGVSVVTEVGESIHAAVGVSAGHSTVKGVGASASASD
jgi:hypothetical protein